ncbi:MAG TPA: TonB-dependent receptor [Bacteroidetes bacterium]|nr:TonB-dependent receptor [Bacteroidota bacterium]
MIGGQATRVMIDGRILQLSGEDLINFLNTIAADDIKKIEIISNPPAQYEAAGNGGLINIIYKKGRRNAWKNSSTISYNQSAYGFTTLRNNFSYNKNKIQFTLSGNASKGFVRSEEKSDAFFPNSIWKVDTDTRIKKNNYSVRSLLDFELNKNISIGIQYLGNFDIPNSIANGSTQFINNTNTLDSLLFTKSLRDDKIISHLYNAHVIAQLDTTGKKLSFDFDYFDYDNNFEINDIVNTFLSDNEFIGINQATNNFSQQAVDNYSFKLDMEHPLKFAQVSYGSKLSFITTINDLKNFNTISGTAIFNNNLSNKFKYEENVQAVYINASKKLNEQWSFQAGLRMEHTKTKGFSKTLNQTNSNNYIKWFPSFYTSYQKNDNHNFSFNYGRGINRPIFRDLNPFRSYLNSNVYSEGNPFIQPSFTDRFSLSHNYKGKLITRLYFSQTNNGFGTLFSAEPKNNIQAIIRRNYFSASYFSISESINFNDLSWWKSQNYISFSRQSTNLDKDLNAKAQNGWQYYFSSNNTFPITKNTKLQLNFWYASANKALLFNIGEIYSFNLGLRQNLLNKNLQLSIFINDIFDTASLSHLESTINGVTTIYGQNYSSRYIRFSLNYNFGNKKIDVKNRDFGNDDERNRAN